MFGILIQYHHLFLSGFIKTLELFGSIIFIGIPLGIIAGIVFGRIYPELKIAIKGLRFLTKVIPVLVLLFWLHYPLQSLLGIVVNPFWTMVIALGSINTVAVANIITEELMLLPKSYIEAAKVLRMHRNNILRYIELPLLMKRVLPQILLVQASMLEYTLFASLISVPELFKTAQSINAMIYRPVEIYSLLVIFFFFILAPLHLLVGHLEKKYVIYD
jgi:ABC-type amino acid transport system permease subunit